MKKERYQFNNAYGTIYEYDENARAYVFIGKYIQFGIRKKWGYKKKASCVEQNKDWYPESWY